ncbi:NO-inducible flavohemoprotein [Marinicrinis sediminis]|uniref:Flavohemoprotein n=1 Tax=Marinicrinis sediminis TaxID=1652465 RepID=A0ABW5RAX4_9BACL
MKGVFDLRTETIEIIKSTVPVLEQHGENITTRFYEMMFEDHPELLNIFNHANQKQGRQQKALAGSIYAAAQHIDQLEKILPVVKQIAHKHRSLGVKAEHYPIVGKYLLLAIKDVLGDAATEEILNAWAEAYQEIAQVFIQVEQEMYAEAEQSPGGWKEFRRFIVDRIVQESAVISSYYLVPEDKKELASFQPGQYVTVKFPIPGESHTHLRQYSLSDSPSKPYYRISVKKETSNNETPQGIVSNAIHAYLQEGDLIELTAPAGDFVLNLQSEKPIVFVAGGVGLTPLVSMLNTVVEAQPTRQVTFIQAAQNSELHAMKEQVKQLSNQHGQLRTYTIYDQPTLADQEQQNYDAAGLIDAAWLRKVIDDTDAEFYFCGPVPFMRHIYAILKQWEIPASQIHYEFFGPAAAIEG